MTRMHALDRLLRDQWPVLTTEADLQAFEATPYAERIAVQSTYEALQRGAACSPDADALVFLPQADPDEVPQRISHRQFMARVTQAANLFTELGIGPGEVVSLLLPLVPESFVCLFGAEAVGIANPVNPLLEAGQIAEILRAANTRVLVAPGPQAGSDIWSKVERIRDQLPALKAIVVVGNASDVSDAARGVHAFDALADRQPAERLLAGRQIASSDTAAYFHTGGTTGMPKLVRHTHGNQVYQAWAMGLMLHLRPGTPLLFGLPLFHVGGALTQALTQLCGGGSLVVLSPAGWRNPAALRNVWRLVERFRPDMLGGVPTVLAAALNVPIDGADVSSIRVCSGGGSAIPVPIGRAYTERLKVPVVEVYGMTETASVHSLAYLDRPLRLGTVGHPVPYSRVRIVEVDAEGRATRDCAIGESGVVAMSGPGVFSGYLSERHNREAFVAPGWVNSGDLGRLDAEGYLWITGRAKDLIIRGGHNIDPMAIEEVFFRHPAVAQASVVGQPDVYAGELPIAFVQLKPGATVDAAALLAFVAAGTPERAAVPTEVLFIEALPLTAVGKVFKPALRWQAAERVVTRLLSDLQRPGRELKVEVGAHALHGSLVTVLVSGVAEGDRGSMERQIDERLDPPVLKHQTAWR